MSQKVLNWIFGLLILALVANSIRLETKFHGSVILKDLDFWTPRFEYLDEQYKQNEDAKKHPLWTNVIVNPDIEENNAS